MQVEFALQVSTPAADAPVMPPVPNRHRAMLALRLGALLTACLLSGSFVYLAVVVARTGPATIAKESVERLTDTCMRVERVVNGVPHVREDGGIPVELVTPEPIPDVLRAGDTIRVDRDDSGNMSNPRTSDCDPAADYDAY